MARRVKLKFYEAGLDMGWSTSPTESFRLFQGQVLSEYDRSTNPRPRPRRRQALYDDLWIDCGAGD